MAEHTIQHCISLDNSLEIMEVDFSRLSFTSKEQIDEFYDEVDRQLSGTKRRWYFLVNYDDCITEPEVWGVDA